MQSLLREGMEEGAFGLSSGLDYPPGSYATTEELAELTRRSRQERRLLPHPRPLLARRPLPRPVPRGDRDRPAGRGAGPHHPLLSPHDVPRHARPDARPGRRRPAERATTSRSTPTRTSGRARASSSSSRSGSRPAARSRRRSASPTRPSATGSGASSRSAARSSPARAGCETSGSATSTGRSCWRGRAGRSASSST